MNQRQIDLVKLLEQEGELNIEALTKGLNASEATIRRDLITLEESGHIVRTIGGARIIYTHSLVVSTFEQKREVMRKEKEKIAIRAADLVKPGMVVAIDSGTTAWRLAAALKGKAPLNIITSALAVLEELGAVEGVSIFCTGGKFRLQNLDFVGAPTIEAFSKLHADIAFFGADCMIPGRGAYSLDEQSSDVARAIASVADVKVLLADHSKIGSHGCFQVLGIDEMDYFVTDSGVDAGFKEELEQNLKGLIIAE